MIAAGIALLPAAMSIAQSETGLALVYFSFLLVMFREGLPAIYLVAGFSLARFGGSYLTGREIYISCCAYWYRIDRYLV